MNELNQWEFLCSSQKLKKQKQKGGSALDIDKKAFTAMPVVVGGSSDDDDHRMAQCPSVDSDTADMPFCFANCVNYLLLRSAHIHACMHAYIHTNSINPDFAQCVSLKRLGAAQWKNLDGVHACMYVCILHTYVGVHAYIWQQSQPCQRTY